LLSREPLLAEVMFASTRLVSGLACNTLA
jgi:hypothetical protein